MSMPAIPVSMKLYKELIATTPPNITLCVRGRHAVGKSEGVYQAAKMVHDDFYKSSEWKQILATEGVDLPHELKNHSYDQGLPVIERRLSQITEGDIVGLPHIHKHQNSDYVSTQFKPCDWLVYACRFPVILFLDERNRALEGVKQAVFQLTDSKAFYGYKLHPQTRIVVAENVGDSYQVQECDPAEISRCATVSLEPSFEEFMSYAKTICHDFTISFLTAEGQKVLEHMDVFEPNKKYQDRRSWVRFDQAAQEQNLFDRCNSPIFYTFACSMLGIEVGSSFTNFCRNQNAQVSALDILTDWKKTKKRIQGKNDKPSNKKYVECIDKLSDYIQESLQEESGVPRLTHDQLFELCAFFFDAPDEIKMKIFKAINLDPTLEYLKVCVSEQINKNSIRSEMYKIAAGKPLDMTPFQGSADKGKSTKKTKSQ